MEALREQNGKLADTLAQTSVDKKASSARNANGDALSSPAANAADGAASGQPQAAPPAPQSVQPEQTGSQSANEGSASRPDQRENARQPENRQGVSTPPPVGQAGRSLTQQSGSRYRPPVQTG